MPTSSYMPDVKVEVAFGSGYSTPAASRVWTDISTYVELDRGFQITGGRGDERSTADANQLTGLVLDNRDGRFTFGKTTGAYYPNVKIGVPIRVTATPVDGAISTRFVGFVNGWPTEWSDGTDATAYATISASSRLARLGTQETLKSIVEIAILADSPAAYYTLGEPADSPQANDSSGNRAGPLVNGDPAHPVIFGSATGPGTDGLTAVTITNQVTVAPISLPYLRGAATLASANMTIECSLLIVDALITNLFGIRNGSNYAFVSASVSGILSAQGPGGTIITSPTALSIGDTHHVALTISGITWTLYGDGVALISGAVAAMASGVNEITVGYPPVGHAGSANNGTWVQAHFAIYDSALSGAQIAAHATAELTGYAGETTSARLIRYAALAGIAATEINAETGSTTVQHLDTTDQHTVDLMRAMETTEQGVLYDERDGTLTFHNRAHRYLTASAYTLNMAEQEVEAGYAPKVDLFGLANDITAANTAGTYSAHQFDTTSKNAYGVATDNVETASQDDDEPLNLASWRLGVYKDPRERAPNLEVDALAQVGKTPNCAAVMATTVGTKLTVSNRPTQAATSSVDYFVEGWTETYGPESLRFTFNVSPSSPWDQTLILSDGTRGFLGTNPLAL